MQDIQVTDNEKARMSSDISRFFYAAGIILLTAVLVTLLWKTFSGYVKLTLVGTEDGCRVSTDHRQFKGGRYTVDHYFVTVERKISSYPAAIDFKKLYGLEDGEELDTTEDGEWETIYHDEVGSGYYKLFEDYSGSRLTFYQDEDGYVFPVSMPGSDSRAAEKDHRKLGYLYAPFGWYVFYVLGLCGGIYCICCGKRFGDEAEHNKNRTVYETPVSFDDI